MWGFPAPTTPNHNSYLTLLTAREVYVSLTAAVLWWRGEVQAVGWVLLLLGVLPADGWVALQNGGAWWQVVQHWAAVPVCAAVGYTLVNTR